MSAAIAVFRRELRIALRRRAEWEQPPATGYGFVAPLATRSADVGFPGGAR